MKCLRLASIFKLIIRKERKKRNKIRKPIYKRSLLDSNLASLRKNRLISWRMKLNFIDSE